MPLKFTEEGLKQAQAYGLGMFLSLAMLVGMFFLLRWIMKLFSDLQASYAKERAQNVLDRTEAIAEAIRREDKYEKREQALTKIITDGLSQLTLGLQTVTQALANVQSQQVAASAAGDARYAILMKAQEMQRIEHATIIANQNAMHDNVKEIECTGGTRRSSDQKTGG
jgi:hypothetical protein